MLNCFELNSSKLAVSIAILTSLGLKKISDCLVRLEEDFFLFSNITNDFFDKM